MNTFFSDKIILWRKMAKIWLKIWLKVKENGTKKNQIGENGGERKRNPSANPVVGLIPARSSNILSWRLIMK